VFQFRFQLLHVAEPLTLPLIELTPNRTNPMMPLNRTQRSGGCPATLTRMMMSVFVLEAFAVELADSDPLWLKTQLFWLVPS
jgi:hypothetical protein